jgi:hypothetical protein
MSYQGVKIMLPSTTDRVPSQTADTDNERIECRTKENVAKHTTSKRKMDRRIRELDREWDIERTLEANAASVALLGLGLGALVNKKFFALPAIVAGFLFQHAIQGWCPPLPIFRKLGFRTQTEIEQERYALKALRGDFAEVNDVDEAIEAVQR